MFKWFSTIFSLGAPGLIKVSFKVNKGNKFGDFGYCPLNRGCPLDTDFTVFRLLVVKSSVCSPLHRTSPKCMLNVDLSYLPNESTERFLLDFRK